MHMHVNTMLILCIHAYIHDYTMLIVCIHACMHVNTMLILCIHAGTVSYIPCSHILRGILVLALSAVSSGYVYGCGCVCELGHIWLAFDLGEALRCMPRCERLGCSLLSPYPVTLWQRLLPATPPSLVLLPFEGREVSFLFPTDSSIIGPFRWLTMHLWLPPGPNSGLPRDYY
jgi:hypothetical protein